MKICIANVVNSKPRLLLLAKTSILLQLYPDTEIVYHASLAGSEWYQSVAAGGGQLMGSFNGDSVGPLTVGKLLEEGLVGRALTTLVYRPEELEQVVSLCDKEGGPVPTTTQWEDALAMFPRLQTALCHRLVDGIGKQDLTMYNLLQADAPFDVTHLFGWQMTNTLFCGDSSFSKMPHLACPELEAQFGARTSLTYTYYLKQARPSFAFCSLIICLLQAGIKTLSSQRLRTVTDTAHVLALRHFVHRPVAASCVAFLEMLGEDTTILRVRLQTAGLVQNHQAAGVSGSAEQRHTAEGQVEKNIVWMLVGCTKRRKRCQVELLGHLEDAIRWQVERLSLKSSSAKTLGLWQLAVLFCLSHDLPPTTGYLADCAKANDWLMFLTFAQLHNIPKDLVHGELSHFSQHALREHLHYVIENVTMKTSTTGEQRLSDVSLMPRDIRAQLYSRIGLTRNKDRVEDSSSDSGRSEDEANMADIVQGEFADEPLILADHSEEDVFGILLACDAMPAPSRCMAAYAASYRNPVLAVLAACYEDHNMVTCMSSWLVASMTDPVYRDIIDTFDPFELRLWTIEDVATILLMITRHGLFKTVLSSLLIFSPDALLVPLLRFCTSFIEYEDPEVCRQHLDTFKVQHAATCQPHSGCVDSADDTLTVEWTEHVARDVLSQILHNTTSTHDLGRLLRVLDQTNCMRLFSCEVPDFSKLYRLHQMMAPTGVTLAFDNLTLTSASPAYVTTCAHALEALAERGMYNEARVFAEVSGMSAEGITLRQMECELVQLSESSVWKQTGTRCAFWRRCHDAFTRHQVAPTAVSKFFQQKITDCVSHGEKGLVCQLAYDWLEVGDLPGNQKLKEDLFVQIWMCKIHDRMEKEETMPGRVANWAMGATHEEALIAQRMELLQYGHIPTEVDAPRVNLSEKERSALETLIGQLLDAGKVKDACQVAALVGHYSRDLSVVIACLKLALGDMSPQELSQSMRSLIASPAPRLARRISTASFSGVPSGSLASLAVLGDDGEQPIDSVLYVLQMLSGHVTRGQFCCQRILTAYQISQSLELTFNWTVLQDEFVVLKMLLNSEHPQCFPLAKAFLATSRLSPSEVAGFLSDTIMKILNTHYGLDDSDNGLESLVEPVGSVTSRKAATGGGMVTGMVMSLIQLFDDSAMLGQRLHDNITSLISSNHHMSSKLLSVCVELLVATHHCYTLACSMEGIADVLRSARKLTELLALADEYNLLIRLLTGVGRFSEMTYIFDILKQQHQLELLFRKGIDKEEGLRMAILDYIMRVHPSDTDTYKMVSLYFTMYREIAAMLEDTAHRQLAHLNEKPLDTNPDAQAILQSVVHYFSDAAESYVKENCLRHAERCVRQARLGALQLALLSSGQRVVNLSKKEVGEFITEHPKFWEAHIVAEAYEDHSHWPSSLCRRYVIHNDVRYLTDFRRHVTITASLITDVAERYKAETSYPKWAVGQMKKVFALCPDVVVAYRAAQDLGLSDYAHDLLKGDNSAFLRDSIGIQY